MKNILALFLALSMIFNVTSELFAQIISDSNQVKSYFEQTDKYVKTYSNLSKELNEEREKQELLKMFGIKFEDYKKNFEAYAKANKINYDNELLQTSWAEQIKTLQEYNNDYLSLIKVFDKKTYQEVYSDSNYFLNKKEDKVKYNGKTYNKIALLHAALHNLITRKTNGYTSKGVFAFSQEKAEDFSLDEKVGVMNHIYNIVIKEGYYPKDEQALYNFAYQIVLNGKKYFDNDIYKADLPNFIMPPAFIDADDRQKRDHGKEDRKREAIAAGKAIFLLSALTKTNVQKQQTAQAVYDLARKTMRGDYGTISILGGAETLISLKTEDSLNKLYTLLTEDLYRGLGTRVLMFTLDSLSLEEWAKRDSGLLNRIKGGLGQYHNAIARRYIYIDPLKNDSEMIRLAQNSVLEGFYNVVYTDMFEDIGNTIGKYSSDEKVARIANRLASKYIQDTANKVRGGEKKLHTSLITGLLATTKQKNETLTKAAKIIYNGSWWDINEATQRDKNNIAARFLGFKNKVYNEQKKKDFKTICAAKNIGRFSDIAVNAIFIGSLVLSLPSIAKKISGFSIFKIKEIKLKPSDVKVINETQVKPTQVKPVQTKAGEIKVPEVKPSTEKVNIKVEEISPKQTEYTATVGEGGGGAIEVKSTITEGLKYSKSQYVSDLASKLKIIREAELFEVENAAKAGQITPFKKGLIINKPWAELTPWRKTLATGLINLKFNTEIFLSSLRVFKPKYAGFTLPLPLTLTGEAFLKPLTLVTQTTETAKSALTTADVFKASQAVREASPVVKVAVGSQAPLKTTNLLDMFQQFSAGKGLLMGGFGIEGVLNEFHGGASSGNSGLSNLEKENLARAAKKPADKVRRAKQEQKKQANVYRDFIATQENLSKEAKEVIQEAYKKHVKGDIKGAISLYDKAIAKMPIVSVYYFGRALLKEYYLKEHFGAIEDLKHAVKLSPNILTYQIVLDDILDNLQNDGQAFITPLDNTEEINNLKQEMKSLKKNLFSKESESKLYLAILPITMSVVMQAVNASVDLVNKIPAIKKAFNKAETKTLELMEKYNFSSQESMEVFSDIFEKELVAANIPLERVQELLQEANSYMKGDHSVRLAREKAQEDPQDQFEEVNKNTTSNYDEALAVFADDLRLFYDSQEEAWKYGYQAREVKETLQEAQPYALGVMYFEKKQYKEAIAEFDKAIEETPVKSAYKMRGQAKYYLGDYEGALKDFNRVISLGYGYNNTAMDYFEIGSLKEMLGDYKGAIADYNKAKELNDYNSDMYGVYDSIYSDAIESATKKMNSPAEKPQTLTEPPAAPSAPKTQTTLTASELFERAESKYDAEDYLPALEDLNQAISLDSDKATYYLLRAQTKEALEDYRGAVADYEECAKVDPVNAPLYFEYRAYAGERYADIQNEKKLKQFWQNLKEKLFGKEDSGKLLMALPFVPKAVMQLLTNDITLEQLSNRQEVIETAFYKAQKRVPQEVVNTDEKEALNQFSYYFKMELEFAGVAQEKTDKLVNKVKEYIKEDTAPQKDKSNVEEVKEQQVSAAVNENKTSEKQKRLSLWAKLKAKKKAENYYNEAISAKEKGDKKTALAYYNQAIEYAPNNAQYLYERGMLKLDLSGDYKGAFEDFSKALLFDNTNETYFYMRALSGYSFMEDKSIPIKDLALSIKYTDPKTSIYIVRNNLFTTWTKGQTYKEYLKDNPLLETQNTQIPQKKSFGQIMSGLKENLFGSRKSSKLYATLLPITTSVILKIVDGISDITDKKRSSAQKAFRKAQAKTEKESLIVYDNATIENIFLANFKAELEKAQVKKKDIEKILEQTKTYFEQQIAKEKEIKQAVFDKYDREQAELDKKEREIEAAKKAQEEKQTAQPKEIKQTEVVIPTAVSEQKPILTEVESEVQNTPKVQEEKSAKTITKKEVSFWDKIKAQRYFKKSYSYNQEYLQKLAMIDKAIELNPNRAEYYDRRATFQVILGKTLSAIADYDKAIELDPTNAKYYYERARIEEAKGQKTAALSDYSKAIELAPTNEGYYFSRALLNYYILERKNDAIRDLALAIKYTDKGWQGWKKSEFKNWSGKTYEEYLKDNSIADERNTKTPQKKSLGQALSGLKGKIFGPKTFGGKLYMSIIPLPPEMLVQFLTGQLTPEQLNNRTSAIEEAFANAEEKTIKNFHDINSPETIAFFLFNLQKELTSANVDQKKAQKLIQISRAYMRQQLPEEVRKTEALMQANRAAVMIVKGDEPQRIVEAYDQAIEWDKTNAYYYFNRGFFGVDLDPKKAKEDLEKAIALDPDNDNYKQFFALFIEAYKDDLGLKKSIKAIFKELMGKLSAILADIKNYAQDKPANSFSKESKITQAQDYAQKAYEKRLKGYYATSVAYYNNAISLDPSKADYYYERALAKHQDIGDYEGAMEDYISAMDLDPENADFYTEQASKAISVKELREEEAQKYEQGMNFNLQNGNIEGALKDIDEAIKINPFNAEYYFYRSNIKYYLEDNKGSFLDIKKALDINPNEAKYYMAMASVRMSFEDFRGTLADIDRAIELDKNNDVYYISRASIRTLFRDFEGVFADYNQAIKLNPTNPDYYVMRANLKYSFEDYEGCLRDYNKAVKLDPENPEYYILRAPIRYGFGDYKGSMADYDKAIELDPEESIYYQLRGIAKGMRNDYEGAIEDYDMAISLDPENPEFYCARALAKADIEGNEESALADFDTAIELDPKNSDYYHERGMTYEDLGDYDNALADYNKAIELDSEEVYYYFSRAMLNKEYDNYADALVDFDKVISLAPNYAEAYYQRGLIREKSLYVTGAFEDFNIAHNLDPQNEEYYKMLIKYYN